MPARAAFVVIGAATVLLRHLRRHRAARVADDREDPWPVSAHDVVAGDHRRVRAGAEVRFGSSVPTAIPAQPTALLALMKLFCTVEVIVTGPSAWSSIAMQSMLRIRFAAVPLFETLKLP